MGHDLIFCFFMLVLDGIGIRQRFVKDMFQMGPGNNWDVLNVNWQTKNTNWNLSRSKRGNDDQQNNNVWSLGKGSSHIKSLDTKEIGWLL